MLASWLLATMILLAPNRDHRVLAAAMANVINSQPALFKNDPTKQRTAALISAINFREGSLQPGVKGDKDKNGKFTSFCSMQIHLPFGAKTLEGWTGEELVGDPEKCITVGLRMLRESMRMCPKHPVAFYAEGRDLKTCDSPRAQKISNDRMFLAARLVKEVPWVEEDVRTSTDRPEPALWAIPAAVYAPRLSGAEAR